jgi:hypothetical protein
MSSEGKIFGFLSEIQEQMDSIQKQMNDRFDKIEENILELKEDNEEFRSNMNSLLEWSERVGRFTNIGLVDVMAE